MISENRETKAIRRKKIIMNALGYKLFVARIGFCYFVLAYQLKYGVLDRQN